MSGTLNAKEKAAREKIEKILGEIIVPKRRTPRQVLIAMIGLVGSGKSTVARALGEEIGAYVSSNDDIRRELNLFGEKYDSTVAIARAIANRVLDQGGNLIIDADTVTSSHQEDVANRAGARGVEAFFVRTYSNMDVAIGRILTANYAENQFFTSVISADWKGEKLPSIVRLRELVRRVPFHYDWEPEGNIGRLHLKELGVELCATIDTAQDLGPAIRALGERLRSVSNDLTMTP